MTHELIAGLQRFFSDYPHPWCVSGGWAIDLFLGRVTRERCDLDVSVFGPGFRDAVRFILGKGWTVEGKLRGGFKRIGSIDDLEDGIRYFWSFPKNAPFISEYVDTDGNRRIKYGRDCQVKMDYVEVFCDTIEGADFMYRREPALRRPLDKAVLERDGCRFLAPEIVLLYKSSHIRANDERDFQAVLSALDAEQRAWLNGALLTAYGREHEWIAPLE